jgi:TerC family integral membrane protein
MDLPAWMWTATICGFLAVIAIDFCLVVRNPREPSLRESTLWVVCYVGMAVLFGVGVLSAAGPRYGGEFFAGWITEYSLSVDNLFVFILIMGSFAVPRQYRQKVLVVGIVLALLMRGMFIAVGAEVVSRFEWIFFLFGGFLIYTAWKLLVQKESDDDEFTENRALRLFRKLVPATNSFNGGALTSRVDGRRVVTPMLVVMVAIGTTDLLFALDSIPAVFGLTQEPYLVLTVNAFALMGLRQLFFLVGGLLDKLVYLSKGLAFILGFIGVKLIMQAANHQGLSWVPDLPIVVSLGVIVCALAVTTVASLVTSARVARAGAPGRTPAVIASRRDRATTRPGIAASAERVTRRGGAPPGPGPAGTRRPQRVTLPTLPR